MLALVLTLVLQPSDVSDYFPLTPGTEWVYEDNADSLQQTYHDRVGNEQTIGGKPAFPIVSTLEGKVDGSTFYRIEDDRVWVVAFDQNRPLAHPYPILKAGTGKNTWEFDGETQWYGGPAPLSIKGSCRKGPTKELFGAKHDTLEVTMDASIGPSDGVGMKSHQVSLYAKGVGLVELKESTKFDKKKTERVRRLVSFTPGQ